MRRSKNVTLKFETWQILSALRVKLSEPGTAVLTYDDVVRYLLDQAGELSLSADSKEPEE